MSSFAPDEVVLKPPKKVCSSCHSGKPEDEFSGFATCDKCRSKKRKHWGKQQAELQVLRGSDKGPKRERMESQELATLPTLPTAEAEIERLLSLLQASNAATELSSSKLSAQQTENETLQSKLRTSDLKYAQSQLLIQKQHEQMAYMKYEAQRCGGMYPGNTEYPDQTSSVAQPLNLMQNVEAVNMYGQHKMYAEPETMYGQQLIPQNAAVDCYALRQDGSLLDYAFSQLEDEPSSSDSQFYSGNGTGVSHIESETFETFELPADAPTESCISLTKNNYVRSLDYGIWFADPELERSFQEQMTRQRRLGMFLAWGLLSLALNMGDVLVSDLGVALYPEIGQLQMLRNASMIPALAYLGRMHVWSENFSESDLTRARYLGELWCYVGGLSSLWFIIHKCYFGGSAAAEDWVVICLKACARTIVFSWSELNPIGAALNVVPLWLALLFVPDVSSVFRFRVVLIGAFMGAVAIMIYRNNREMFVNQVRLQHAHLVTTELKRAHSSKPSEAKRCQAERTQESV